MIRDPIFHSLCLLQMSNWQLINCDSYTDCRHQLTGEKLDLSIIFPFDLLLSGASFTWFHILFCKGVVVADFNICACLERSLDLAYIPSVTVGSG